MLFFCCCCCLPSMDVCTCCCFLLVFSCCCLSCCCLVTSLFLQLLVFVCVSSTVQRESWLHSELHGWLDRAASLRPASAGLLRDGHCRGHVLAGGGIHQHGVPRGDVLLLVLSGTGGLCFSCNSPIDSKRGVFFSNALACVHFAVSLFTCARACIFCRVCVELVGNSLLTTNSDSFFTAVLSTVRNCFSSRPFRRVRASVLCVRTRSQWRCGCFLLLFGFLFFPSPLINTVVDGRRPDLHRSRRHSHVGDLPVHLHKRSSYQRGDGEGGWLEPLPAYLLSLLFDGQLSALFSLSFFLVFSCVCTFSCVLLSRRVFPLVLFPPVVVLSLCVLLFFLFFLCLLVLCRALLSSVSCLCVLCSCCLVCL